MGSATDWEQKKMESFMSWVLKTELHYLALLLFAEIHILPHTVPLAIAFRIGTSEVEMVLSTQCIMQPKPKKMLINVAGDLLGVTPKTLLFISSQNYLLQALLVILWNTQEKF
jgi:ABC-type maltose transport system permease subunit